VCVYIYVFGHSCTPQPERHSVRRSPDSAGEQGTPQSGAEANAKQMPGVHLRAAALAALSVCVLAAVVLAGSGTLCGPRAAMLQLEQGPVMQPAATGALLSMHVLALQLVSTKIEDVVHG